MAEDVIERYYTFNTKGCLYELIFGNFYDQLIPSDYYNILNDDNDDVNNITGTPVDYALPDNKGVEDAVFPSDEDINDEIIIDYDDRLASAIDPLQNEIMEIEGVDSENGGGVIEGVEEENEGVDSENEGFGK